MLISISQLIAQICQPCLSLSVSCKEKRPKSAKMYQNIPEIPVSAAVSVCFSEKGKDRKKTLAIGFQITLLPMFTKVPKINS